MSKFYNISINTPGGKPLNMNDFKGKVVLIINTATKCGFTHQFVGLEELHKKYGEKGLVVLGCPCNQFGGQEPLANEDMSDSCRINHGVTFQLTEKIDVNGKNGHPLFDYLKKEKGSWLGKKIKWNFTKFLVDGSGKVVNRYSPTTIPAAIEKDIQPLIYSIN